jgi:hypothetical protein
VRHSFITEGTILFSKEDLKSIPKRGEAGPLYKQLKTTEILTILQVRPINALSGMNKKTDWGRRILNAVTKRHLLQLKTETHKNKERRSGALVKL